MRKYKFKMSDRRGFTLIELIVVMAIIAILVLMATPWFLGNAERANDTRDMHAARTLENSMEGYMLTGGAVDGAFGVVPIADIRAAATSGHILSRTGKQSEIVEDVYYELTDAFIRNTLHVSGAFHGLARAAYVTADGMVLVDRSTTPGEGGVGGPGEPDVETAPLIRLVGGSSWELFRGAVSTSDGGLIAVGESASNDGDFAGMRRGLVTGIIVKFDSTGVIEWKLGLGGSSRDGFNSIANASDGGYVVLGGSSSSDGDFFGLNHGGEDGILVKLDSFGNVEWITNIGGSGADRLLSVASAADGGYVLAGSSNSTDGDFVGENGRINAVVVKVDSQGEVSWTRSVGGDMGDRFESISPTSDGGYIATGNTWSSNGDLAGIGKGGTDGLLVKFDSAGNREWIQAIGGSGFDNFHSVTQTLDGGYIIAGDTTSINGDFTGTPLGQADGVLVKTDSTGLVEWFTRFGGSDIDKLLSVTLAQDGGYVALGFSYSEDGDMEGVGDEEWWQADAPVLKYDASGNLEWLTYVGGTYDDTNEFICPAHGGGYIVVGWSSSDDGHFVGLEKGSWDASLFKLNVDGSIYEYVVE